MALSVEDFIYNQIGSSGFTILDHAILLRLAPNWGSASFSTHFDKPRVINGLLNAKAKFFHAWISENSQPVLVAAWSGRDLARRLEYLVGEPILVKPVDTDEVRQSIAPQPEPLQPHQQAGHKPEHVKVREAQEAKRTREEAEAAVRWAQNKLKQIKAEPKQLSVSELEERRPEIEARIELQERLLRQAEEKLKAILEARTKAS